MKDIKLVNLLKENVGLQDKIACFYGGFNLIKFNKLAGAL